MKAKTLLRGSENPDSAGYRFRIKRFKFFEDRIKPLPKPLKIIDVGGTELFWINRNFHNNPDYLITLINKKVIAVTSNNITSLTGDATDLSQFNNNAFDIAFSNSVIEHLETWNNQVRMANEVRRVGVYYFVQTPNRYFPVEPHYLFPFFQFLPDKVKYLILTKTKLSRGHTWQHDFVVQYIKEIRLLTMNEMKGLFPDSKVYIEKFMGMTKSFTMHNFKD